MMHRPPRLPEGDPQAEATAAVRPGRGFGNWRPSLRIGMLVLSLIALVPMSGMLTTAILVARQNTGELWQTQSRHSIERLSEGVRRELDPIRESGAYLAAQVASGRLDPSDGDTLSQHLSAALAGLPQVSDLAFLSTRAQVTTVNRERQRVTRADWSDDPRTLANLSEGERAEGSYWSGFFYARAARSTRLELRTPIHREGRYLGLLISVVTTSGLSELVTRAGTEMDGVAFLLAGRESVVAHPRLTRPVEGVNAAHPLPRIDEVDDDVLAGMWRQRDTSLRRYRLLETEESHVAQIEGREHIYLYRPLAGIGPETWLVGLHRPLDRIDAPFRRLWLLLGAGVLSLVMSAVAFWLIGQRLTRPLEKLSERARLILNFDWSGGPVPRALFREIDQAAGTFNALAKGLAKASTYLPAHLVRRLLQGEAAGLGQTGTRDVTVMFTDIVGFSTKAAGLSPAAAVTLLNAHFNVIVPCVERNDGTVDKFIGDGLMAFWGAPELQPEHAELALCAALDMQAAVETENAARRQRGEVPIRMRIGLHSGPALAGNIGAPGRIDYTLIGDTVNVAQRMEALAREFMEDQDVVVILMSGETLRRVGPGLEKFSVGTHLVPGHGGEVEVFRLA